MDNSFLPRGLRNHNPLNIRINGDKWQGLAPVEQDKAFLTFVSNAYGYRAAFRIMKKYYGRNVRTIRSIISTWAPPTENNVRSYINQVSRLTGIPADRVINWKDEETMVALVHAMAIVENGMKYLEFIKEEEIRQGYNLAFG